MNGHDTRQLPAVPATTTFRVVAMLQQNDWTLRHGKSAADHAARRLRANSSTGSHENDRAIEVKRLQAHRCGKLPATGTPDRLTAAKRTGWLPSERGEGLGKAARRNTEQQNAVSRLIVDTDSNWRYGSSVAVSPAADLGRLTRQRRTSAQAQAGAFLLPVLYGGCARDTFGCAGLLCPRSANPRTAVTILCLAASGDGSTDKGAPPMNHPHAPNPSTAQQHAAAWRARAIAALHSDSSLATRLRRFNEAMARARSLEAQEVAHV